MGSERKKASDRPSQDKGFSFSVNIIIENRQSDVFLCENSLRLLIQELLYLEKISTDEISIRLVDQKEASELHKKYFNDPSCTDCMTFPIDPPGSAQSLHCLGEIVICPQTAVIEHLLHNTTLEEELSLYIIHSFLHLIGLTDKTSKNRDEMRAREAICLAHLKRKASLLTITKACC